MKRTDEGWQIGYLSRESAIQQRRQFTGTIVPIIDNELIWGKEIPAIEQSWIHQSEKACDWFQPAANQKDDGENRWTFERASIKAWAL